jgi:2-aminoadipate transaminase
VMEEALAHRLGGQLTSTTPRGGFFLWAAFADGLDAEQVLARALESRVSFVIGSAFFVDGSGRDTLRLSFSQPSDAELVEGVSRLAGAVARTVEEGRDQGEGGAPSVMSGISSPKG